MNKNVKFLKDKHIYKIFRRYFCDVHYRNTVLQVKKIFKEDTSNSEVINGISWAKTKEGFRFWKKISANCS
jgi:hypothetical protein